jgi:hypothetical protein
MKFFFLFAVLMVLPFVSASGLRNDLHDMRTNPVHKPSGPSRMKVGAASYPGTFPASPIYATTQLFEGGCGTALTLVETTLTGVCFTDGTGSSKYSCSKY